jgi:SOS response regulatory protein OraA/RecX
MPPPPRQADALALATRALARREHSEHGLRERLARAGVEPGEAEKAVAVLRRAGLLDDGRFAAERARVLAERGRGDAAIRLELERAGVGSAAIEAALVEVEPERARAERIVARRGAGPATARFLAAKGFDEETVAGAVARDA